MSFMNFKNADWHRNHNAIVLKARIDRITRNLKFLLYKEYRTGRTEIFSSCFCTLWQTERVVCQALIIGEEIINRFLVLNQLNAVLRLFRWYLWKLYIWFLEQMRSYQTVLLHWALNVFLNTATYYYVSI